MSHSHIGKISDTRIYISRSFAEFKGGNFVKIKAIMPDKARDRATLDSREKMLSEALSSGVELSVDTIKSGPDNSDTYTDGAFASPDMIRQCIQAEKDGFDAIVIYCFDDVAIDAIRENVRIPVIGPGESTLAVAGIMFSRFSVVTSSPELVRPLYRSMMKNCVAREKMISVLALDIPLVSLRADPPTTERRLFEVCERAMIDDRVDGFVLGCLGMATYGKSVEKRLRVKVLDPAFISVAFAEMSARLNLSHTETTYPRFVNHNRLDI